MADTRQKTISYRRAVWLGDKEEDLEALIKKSHGTLKTIKQRKFQRGDGQYLKGIALKSGKSGGHFLHIVAETPGDHASTLAQQDEGNEEGDVGTAPPPPEMEFMDGDIFVYVNGNDVCMCSTVLRDGAVAMFCRDLFDKAKLGNKATQFELQKIANVDKVKMINAQGVKEVNLKASLYDATVSYVKRGGSQGWLGTLGSHLSALWAADKKPKPDNLSVGITITSDGRKGGKALGAKRIADVAKDVLKNAEDEDSYHIVTSTGQRITQSEIYVRTKVNIQRRGKSVDRNKAWNALERFYIELDKAGVTAQ